ADREKHSDVLRDEAAQEAGEARPDHVAFAVQKKVEPDRRASRWDLLVGITDQDAATIRSQVVAEVGHRTPCAKESTARSRTHGIDLATLDFHAVGAQCAGYFL